MTSLETQIALWRNHTHTELRTPSVTSWSRPKGPAHRLSFSHTRLGAIRPSNEKKTRYGRPKENREEPSSDHPHSDRDSVGVSKVRCVRHSTQGSHVQAKSAGCGNDRRLAPLRAQLCRTLSTAWSTQPPLRTASPQSAPKFHAVAFPGIARTGHAHQSILVMRQRGGRAQHRQLCGTSWKCKD